MITIIAAIDVNNCLGINGTIPWTQRADMKRFKDYTNCNVVVMGRKTFESIGGPLKHRTNIVMTHKPLKAYGCIIASSVDRVLAYAKGNDIFVIGGGEVYTQFMPIADKLLITELSLEIRNGCDAKFPTFDHDVFKRVSCETHKADSENQYDYTFVNYERNIK